MGAPTGPRHLRAEAIDTARLRLEPLRVEHADELVAGLDDPALHAYVGGQPATLAQLRGRFQLKARGMSDDLVQTWLNWVVRERGAPTGFVQATLTPTSAGPLAELAWVTGVEHQGQGYATEAAAGVVTWLGGRGVRRFIAHVHPANAPSRRVAAHLGMHPTDVVVDGETEWVVSSSEPPAAP